MFKGVPWWKLQRAAKMGVLGAFGPKRGLPCKDREGGRKDEEATKRREMWGDVNTPGVLGEKIN